MSLGHSPSIVRNGLVVCLDAADPKSYSGSGTAWNDRASTSNATLVNGPAFSTSDGGGFTCDGIDDQIDMDSDVLLGSQFTISLNVKFSGSRSDWVRLAGHSNDSSVRYWGLWTPNSRSYLLWQSYSATPNFNLSTAAFTFENDVFYNIVVVGDGTNVKFYINGDLLTNSNSGGVIDYSGNTSNLTLGYAGFHQRHLGKFFSFHVYNRTLSEKEIIQNYNATKGRFGL